jgi:phosphatidate cytidylyltransferase
LLKQRVVTAVLLLAVLVAVLWAPRPEPFLAFVALAIGLAAWEWAWLNGLRGFSTYAFGAGALVVLLLLRGSLASVPTSVWLGVLALWVLGGTWALQSASVGWQSLAGLARLSIGLLVLVPAGLALLNWKALGLNALLSALCLVWVADVAAYFGGRRFGRRKLAPAISPGKSWEGVFSGVLGVLLLAVIWIQLIDTQPWVDGMSLYGRLVSGMGWPLTVLVLLVLAALSVVGDLFESLVKRAAGAKDSSQLLPGHGGVLDRVDALLPVLPAALGFVALAKAMA